MKTEFFTRKSGPKNSLSLSVLMLLFLLTSAIVRSTCFADGTAPAADDIAMKGVLRTVAGPGGETTGVELCPLDDLNNAHGTAIEVDLRGLKDEDAARSLVTEYGEADKRVDVTGVYEYLDLGPMRPHFKVLLAQDVRAE